MGTQGRGTLVVMELGSRERSIGLLERGAEVWADLCGSAGKESTCNAGDLSLIPGLGRSPGEGKGYPLKCSGLENPMESMGSQRVRHD